MISIENHTTLTDSNDRHTVTRERVLPYVGFLYKFFIKRGGIEYRLRSGSIDNYNTTHEQSATRSGAVVKLSDAINLPDGM